MEFVIRKLFLEDRVGGLFQELFNRFLMVCQLPVIKKLSSIQDIILSNFFMGTAKERVPFGTQGRAEGSNIPITALGLSELISR